MIIFVPVSEVIRKAACPSHLTFKTSDFGVGVELGTGLGIEDGVGLGVGVNVGVTVEVGVDLGVNDGAGVGLGTGAAQEPSTGTVISSKQVKSEITGLRFML